MKNREEQLWEYVEGRLPGPEQAALEQWLDADPRNRRQLEEIQVLSDSLRSLDTDAPSFRFTANVMEAWDAELAARALPLRTRTDKRIVFAIGALLAGALVLVFGLFLLLPKDAVNGRFIPDSELTSIGNGLSHLFSGFGKYAIGLIMLLCMVLTERYLHYRHSLRNIRASADE